MFPSPTKKYRAVGINGAGKVSHLFDTSYEAKRLAKSMVCNSGPSGRPSFVVALVEVREDDGPWKLCYQIERDQ